MTTRRLIILTGASRGLGAAMARQLLGADTHLLTLSRHPEAALVDAANASGTTLEQWALDLGHDVGSSARLETWLHQHAASQFRSATLINNAGVVGRVGPIDASDAETLASVLRVGLEAPMLLTSAFLRAPRAPGRSTSASSTFRPAPDGARLPAGPRTLPPRLAWTISAASRHSMNSIAPTRRASCRSRPA